MPTNRGGLIMFQSKKLTESPKSIGMNVKLKKSSKLGPRKKRAHNQSRRCRRPARGVTAAALGVANVDADDTFRPSSGFADTWSGPGRRWRPRPPGWTCQV